MIKKEFEIKNPTGLHIRPAGLLCEEAMNHKAKITFIYGSNNSEANCKSILSILGSCVRSGDRIELCCDGEDEGTDRNGLWRKGIKQLERLKVIRSKK